jgi:hypothetical protein
VLYINDYRNFTFFAVLSFIALTTDFISLSAYRVKKVAILLVTCQLLPMVICACYTTGFILMMAHGQYVGAEAVAALVGVTILIYGSSHFVFNR